MQVTGKLIQTTGVEQISDTFKKTNIIIQTEYDSQYPQEISVECHNDNLEKIKSAGVVPGDVVTLDCNLRGKKYEKDGQPARWFNTIVMWKITKNGSTAPAASAPVANTTAASSAPAEDDSLPF
ncbi:MAG: DUF3127 domain-containing protein [Chryseobacterium sp.]|nr:MAG: DUF3127 domain-containing protein [Chryseobacterium sp.]